MNTVFALLCWVTASFFLTEKVFAARHSASDLEQLARNSEWHALLHYEYSQGNGEVRSAINSSSFFLADDGAQNALAELIATINAFEAAVEVVDLHARCRFPARFLWLEQFVSSLSELPPLNCEPFQEWLGTEKVTSISMIFAAGHMKSPASFFGHNFLKFNTNERHSGATLLDDTINFGADVPDGEGGLTYFYHGVFGGYTAVYERQPFYRHMAKYGEEDLRDVWEYELDFTQREINLIVAHTFELQQIELTYYFFRENCAYQIARLLALVTPAQLVPQFMPWTMPYNVFSALMEVRINGRALVKDIHYHPSRRSRFHQRYFVLSADEKRIFVQQVGNRINRDQLDSLSLDSQLRLIDALIDYFEFRLRLDSSDIRAEEDKNTVLLHRFGLPARDQLSAEFELPFAPHLAQRPGYVGLTVADNQRLGRGVEVRLRPAYFDFLSLDIGRSTIGEFTVLDTALFAGEDDYLVKSFDLLNVTNLAPSLTGIAGDSGSSWHFRAGVRSTNNACLNCQRAMLDWQRGKSVKFSSNVTGYLLAGGRIQKSYERDHTFALKIRAGVVGRVFPGLRLNALIERHEDTGNNGLDRNRVRLALRFGERRAWDVRLRYERDVAEEFSVTAGFYW